MRHRRIVMAFVALACVTFTRSADTQSPPATPLRLLSSSGIRTLPSLVVGDVEMVALDDLASVFPLTVREDTAARAIIVEWRGQTIALTREQSLASVGGRLVSLPAPPRQIANRWHVPIEFIDRALASTADPRIELRKASRLIIVGNLVVPRVTVRHEVPGPQARLTIDISPPTGHTVVQEANRLLVRFEAPAIDSTIAPFTSRGLIQAVRPAEAEAPTLVVDLGPKFGSFRASDPPHDGRVARLIIDVFPAVDTTGPSAPPPPEPTAPEPALSAPAAGLRTIVIDPGHGGDEPGARGPRGTLEKDVTLALARRLKTAIESRLGARVLLTREDDRTVPLDARAALANNNKADLFISLHANASIVASPSGAEVFYLGLERHAEEARRIAEAERTLMPVFGGGTREIDIMLWEMAQARYIEESAVLAGVMEEELRRVVPIGPQAVRQGPFRVLVGANMPAVLVELGYLSNPAQEAQLQSGDFAARLTQALLAALMRFDARTRSAAAAVPVVEPVRR